MLNFYEIKLLLRFFFVFVDLYYYFICEIRIFIFFMLGLFLRFGFLYFRNLILFLVIKVYQIIFYDLIILLNYVEKSFFVID